MSTVIPLYVGVLSQAKRGGETILHRDRGCGYLARFDAPLATAAQRQEGRLRLLRGDDTRAKGRRSARRGTRSRPRDTDPVTLEEWRARQSDQTLGKDSPE
jgi:hypothetical protein